MKYELPTASESRLGGIRVGEDFEIDQDGTLNIKDMEEMKEQVEELPQKVAAGKSLIAEAITEKGVPTEATDSFATMAENIRSIPNAGADFITGSKMAIEKTNDHVDVRYEYQPLIPAMTSNTTPEGVASCSSYLGANFEAFRAFNRVSADDHLTSNSWLAASTDETPWLMYELPDRSVNFYVPHDIELELLGSFTSVTRRLYIEGSNNGNNFTNCLKNFNYVTVDFENLLFRNYRFDLNGNRYRYIRIRCDEPYYAPDIYACGFSRVQVYGRISVHQ